MVRFYIFSSCYKAKSKGNSKGSYKENNPEWGLAEAAFQNANNGRANYRGQGGHNTTKGGAYGKVHASCILVGIGYLVLKHAYAKGCPGNSAKHGGYWEHNT